MPDRSRSTSRSRSLVAVAFLIVSATLAGCSLPADPDPDNGGLSLPSAGEAASQAERLESLQVTTNRTVRHDGNVSWSIQRISTRPDTGEFRNEVLATSPPADERRSFPPGSRVVSNGTVRYIYRAGADRVYRSAVSREPPDRSSELRRLFGALDDGRAGTIRYPTPGVAPLPVVPRGTAPANESVRWRETNVTARLNGTATVAGRSTYVIDLRPVTEDTTLVASTLWLDTEYLYPLKSHRIVERNGERYEYTSRVQNLTFNPAFPPGTFAFDPDAVERDVTVVESASYDSRAAMAADLDRSVPEPDLPEGFAFDSGYYAEGDRTHLSVTYTDPSANGSLRVSVFDAPANLTGGRQVSLDGRPAVFETFRDRRFLVWNANGRQYSVSGTVGNATLRRVAESLVSG